MTQAASIAIALAIPQTAGAFPQPPWPPTPATSVAFTESIAYPRIVISGAGSLTLADFSLLPTAGCQILLVTLDGVDGSGAALTAPVRFNLSGATSGTVWLPLGGGAFAIVAPGTVGSVTGLQIVTTAPAVVRVQAVA